MPESVPHAKFAPETTPSASAEWRQQHPIATANLLFFTFLPTCLIVALAVGHLIWTPWQPHAFQATTSGEIVGHGFQLVIGVAIGGPLAFLGVVCGHCALVLVWSRLPWPSPPAPARRRGIGGLALRGALVLCLAVCYASALSTFGYFVWRSFVPETI